MQYMLTELGHSGPRAKTWSLSGYSLCPWRIQTLGRLMNICKGDQNSAKLIFSSFMESRFQSSNLGGLPGRLTWKLSKLGARTPVRDLRLQFPRRFQAE